MPKDEVLTYAWDIQPGESPEAYRAFTFYLMGGSWRSQQKSWDAYQVERARAEGRETPTLSKTPGHWARWAAQWSWVERSTAWDAEQARKQREVLQSEMEGIARKRVKALTAVLDKGLEIIQKADLDALSGEDAAEKIGVAANMIATSVAQLRSEAGEPDRVHVSTGEPDLDDLTTEELEGIVAAGVARRRASFEPPEGGDESERLLPDDVPELHDGSSPGATS